MSIILEALETIYSDHVWLEVVPKQIEKAWPSEHDYSYDVARWTAFKNRLTLDAFLVWIEEASGIIEQPSEWPSREDLPSIWEVVNGTAVQIGKTRIILIPNDENDIDELCVPAEWVDIPSWAGDYYLAVQVNTDNPDGRWLRFWGYTTHKKLKQVGQFDKIRRTYSLEREEVIEDLNVMWVARKFDRDEKAPVESVPNLSAAEAEELLQHLGQPSCYSPRFRVDFEKWRALIANRTWQQRLYERRLEINIVDPNSVLVKLGQWFQSLFEPGWQPVELVMIASHRGSNSKALDDSARSESISRAKKIELHGQQLAMIVTVRKETNDDISAYLRLCRAGKPDYLPRGLQIIVQDESGEICAQAQAGYGLNWLHIGYDGKPGKKFHIKVAFRDVSLEERFVF